MAQVKVPEKDQIKVGKLGKHAACYAPERNTGINRRENSRLEYSFAQKQIKIRHREISRINLSIVNKDVKERNFALQDHCGKSRY